MNLKNVLFFEAKHIGKPGMIREFHVKDTTPLLELFDANTPKYFHPEEKEDLKHYLENEVENYFVYTFENGLVAAGGINYKPEEHTAILSWDIVHPEFQGKGIGSELVKHRLHFIAQQRIYSRCIVRTSQLVYPFYLKHNFKLISKHPDFWAKGYDMYYMKLIFES
ncbi:N-acetylglutamate synthase, GNAT family [Lishizhenia tianjinensis]|uniref:N-acetylglutamate synthase, GNAT family n=1 Tax=Lishizhenia tianjinensis TaxID=477690 RepID=A0A1I6X889_9FLAO|nr:GNAT family N-acetyltransferase [Lishizhenia tianjinensis]SFT34598.1 N-acetylglutamate synthase, GNAT family [Lishizhenia tianjinensis]